MSIPPYLPDCIPGGQIHNMSTPPRTRLVVHPYRTKEGRNEGSPLGSSAGLTIRMQISRDHVLRKHIPGFMEPEKRNSINEKHVLIGLLILSRIAQGGEAGQARAEQPSMMKRTTESLMDEYLENVGLLNPVELGLPAFAIVRPLYSNLDPVEDPAQMLAVMSRITNGIFIASRLPVLPECYPDFNPHYLLYIPG